LEQDDVIDWRNHHGIQQRALVLNSTDISAFLLSQRFKNSGAVLMIRIVIAPVIEGLAQFLAKTQIRCRYPMDFEGFPGFCPPATLFLPPVHLRLYDFSRPIHNSLLNGFDCPGWLGSQKNTEIAWGQKPADMGYSPTCRRRRRSVVSERICRGVGNYLASNAVSRGALRERRCTLPFQIRGVL
jgi:hypothetical protein